MKHLGIGLAGTLFLMVAAAISLGDVKVTVDHNDTDHSTAEFKFKNVPSPAKTNEATTAKFTIVDGDKDENSAELDALHDGKLPGEQDEPASNFFFNAGTDGGRIVIDLGKPTEVKQVNTYSWHTDTRAPQVYNLYGSDGTDTKFNSAPNKDTDPTTCGWKLIAKVDTRPKTGDNGGQYGVSVADGGGASLGKYRYLLMVISRTESDDDWGNTFYSEINVIGNDELLGQPQKEGDKPGQKLVEIDGGKYSALIDTTQAPDLTDWADTQLAPVVAQWYPKLVEMLPSPGYSAPTHFSITFRDMQGVAYTTGTRVTCAAGWFRGELTNEAKGAVVHEMVHVVQQYGSARRTNRHPQQNPGWLVEGIADYERWYKYEPQSHGTNISRRGYDRARYDGSYRVTANFLNFVSEKYDKNLVEELDATMREGNYSQDVWSKLTGKTVEELGGEWKGQLARALGIPTTQPTGV